MADIDHVRLTITVDIRDKLDHYYEEDIAKQMWPYLTPFLTRRHGISHGKVILEGGAVEIAWKYEDLHEEKDYAEGGVAYAITLDD